MGQQANIRELYAQGKKLVVGAGDENHDTPQPGEMYAKLPIRRAEINSDNQEGKHCLPWTPGSHPLRTSQSRR